MRPVLTVAEMRAVDQAAQATVSLDTLVARAGAAVAAGALDLMGGAYGRRVVVLAGPGNNGADGRVAAAALARRGARVTVVPVGRGMAVPDLGPCNLVIDAAFGTGFRGEFDGPPVPGGVPVLAVDIPSGVDGDTGVAAGSPLPATATVTFAAEKPGLLQGDGPGLAGPVRVADIGLPTSTARIHVVEDGDVAPRLPRRRRDDHKWRTSVLVVAGSPGMTGAAELCARGALRAGAGMVRVGVPGAPLGTVPVTETVGVALPERGWAGSALEELSRCRALVVGPGLGRHPEMAAEVARFLAAAPVPAVVDADALVALAGAGAVPAPPGAPRVITPHAGEYRTLVGEDLGPDRVAAARRLAAGWGAVTLVKGTTTAVADPDGSVLLATAATSALATAGTGDVLAGVIGALLARGTPALWAASLGAHVHGRAGGIGPAEGLRAGDLPDAVSAVLSALLGAGTLPGPGGEPGPAGGRR